MFYRKQVRVTLFLSSTIYIYIIQIHMIHMCVKIRVLMKSSGKLMIVRCLGKLAPALTTVFNSYHHNYKKQ